MSGIRLWGGTRGGEPGVFTTLRTEHHLSRSDFVSLLATEEWDPYQSPGRMTKARAVKAVQERLWLYGHPHGAEAVDEHGTDHEDEALEWAEAEVSRLWPEWTDQTDESTGATQ